MNGNDRIWLRVVSKRDHRLHDREASGGVPSPAVFVVEDDDEMRTLFAHLLEPLGLPVEAFASAEEFLEQFDTERPGCLVLDVRLPGMDGFALFNALKAAGSRLPVVFVTGYADVAGARYALLAGAFDFFEKPVERRALLASVRSALESDQERRRSAAVADRLSCLTTREWEVLKLVVAGKANKIIGSDLGISQKTVEAHRARVMSKTGADSVADLVRIFSAFESSQAPLCDEREALVAGQAAHLA